MSPAARCPHCGTPVEGADDRFCCHGCEMAAVLIRDAGLERYYAEREAFAPRPEPETRGWDTVPVEPEEDGSCSVRLVVDGLRCASCVWVTEGILEREPGVVGARVSYATGRTWLRWDPESTDLATLVGRIASLGYRPRLVGTEASPDRDLLLRLGVAAFGAANVMLLSASIYAGWLGPMAPRFLALFQWVALAVATPVALWSAAPFFQGALSGLRARRLHMDVPIALAVAILWVHAVVVTVGGWGDTYLDSLCMLVALLLAGRLVEGRGRRRAAEAAGSLASTVPATARRLEEDGRVSVVATSDLRPGDRVAVAAGEEIPADGVVVEGYGLARLALLTGEAEPVTAAPGARTWAGTVLEDGALELEVTERAEDTVVQRMARALEEALDPPEHRNRADRLAPGFTAATLAVAALTLGGWWAWSGLPSALEATIAVLVVACPCALALSQPLATAAGLGAAGRRGLLLRSADALLELGGVTVVALDKTGTVTAGEMDVTAADPDVLRLAAGIERFSTHPVARAIVREAGVRGIPLPTAHEVRETPGRGIEGTIDGQRWRLERGGPGQVDLVDTAGRRRPIRLGDRIRTDSKAAIEAIRARGARVVLLTGDHDTVARRMADEAGVDEVHASFDPEAKATWIRTARESGEVVVFVGDGLNDGPGLAAASVGVAMGGGATSSILAADGVLASSSLAPVAVGVLAGRAADHAVRANLIRSVVYNIVAVAAAAAGLVNPLVAAILMPLSSGLVLWGASRVERTVAEGEAVPARRADPARGLQSSPVAPEAVAA